MLPRRLFETNKTALMPFILAHRVLMRDAHANQLHRCKVACTSPHARTHAHAHDTQVTQHASRLSNAQRTNWVARWPNIEMSHALREKVESVIASNPVGRWISRHGQRVCPRPQRVWGRAPAKNERDFGAFLYLNRLWWIYVLGKFLMSIFMVWGLSRV